MSGPDKGRTFDVTGSGSIGRMPNLAVTLNDPDVSREHALLRVDDDEAVWVADMGSRNGIFVNNVRVKERRLEIGDELRLGSHAVLQVTEYDPVEHQLVERQRLECVGRLALGVAHDFNNMLSAVETSLDFLRSLPPERRGEPDGLQCVEDMRIAAEKSSELAGQLLRAGRSGKRLLVPLNLSEVCRDMVELTRRTLGRHIAVTGAIESGLTVRGDAAALRQILMNLCVNARDAMIDGGELKVTLEREVHPDGADRGGRGILTVQDTGVGIPADDLELLFEPHYTTKAPGAGFGLGLSMVKDIVVRHGGSVDVTSRPGVGTTFRIVLPLEPTVWRKTATGRKHLVATTDSAAGTILLVDDEDVVRRSMRRLLKQAGYKVVEAADGREAVTWFQNADPPPDLVILDVEMPELDGVGAFLELHQVDPRVRVAFLTGDTTDARAEVLHDLGDVDVLTKPLGAGELLGRVSRAIQRPRVSIHGDEDTRQGGQGSRGPTFPPR
ncbi:MAG: response regulator [Deltaproteobacteria bacterium]|nr:response regulator [Deltaproteobacteria bacterium]